MKKQWIKAIVMTIILASFGFNNLLKAQQIDIGIFATTTSEIEVYMRPDFFLDKDHFISEIRYTIRWPDPTIGIVALTPIPPFNIVVAPFSDIISGGFRYQTFIFTPAFVQFGTDVNAGDEVLISSFTHNAGPGVTFELATAAVTPLPNTDYFFELACGTASPPCSGPGVPPTVDVTGILYAPTATTPAAPVPLATWPLLVALFLMGTTLLVFLKRS